MRVAHVITRMILGGAQENTLLCCEDLLHLHGDDVLLITGPALGPEGSLLLRAKERGVPVEIIPQLRRAIHPWRDWSSYHAVVRVIKRFGPDVVHTHSAKGGIVGRAAAWKLRVPCVIHGVHGAPFYPYQSAAARVFYRACERWAAKRCHAFISVANAMTELMVSAGVAPAEKFTTIYSGMDVDPFLNADEHRAAMRSQLGYAQEDVVVVKVARLFDLKGHADVVAAAASVIQQNPRVQFLFVGDGLLKSQLEQQIQSLGLARHFKLVGLVPAACVPQYLGAGDLVVHASLREGLARVLPQALIAGKPVISYDIDGAREVVLPGKTGHLLKPRDVAGLAAAITQLAANPQERTAFGQTGRRLFAEQFRHEVMTRQVRALYQQILDAR